MKVEKETAYDNTTKMAKSEASYSPINDLRGQIASLTSVSRDLVTTINYNSQTLDRVMSIIGRLRTIESSLKAQ